MATPRTGGNAGNPAGCTDFADRLLTTDQQGRGRPHPPGGRRDSGAFERQG